MKPESIRTAALGFAAGVLVVMTAGAGQIALHQADSGPSGDTKTIDDTSFSGRRGGKFLVGERGIAYAPSGTETEDLGDLTPSDDMKPGRYEAIALGNGGSFVVLDTATGLANVYTEDGRLRVYNQGRPNHFFTIPMCSHQVLD